MNALVKKEIRLLLPGWLAVLSLVILSPWFWKDSDATFAWMPLLIFFSMILLAVDSFGREFSLGTFQSLLSQPIERRQIWRTKITVLLFAAVLILAAYFINSEFLLLRALKIPVWGFNPTIIGNNFRDAMIGNCVAVLVALVGGLWTTLLFRQIAAAFWLTFLVPAGLLMLIIFFLPAKLAENDHIVESLLYSVAALYIVLGFWLAHRLFHRAQDVAWTGGVISFSKWRYFEAGYKSSISVRRRKPITSLLKKEFQLHGISLFCAGALFVLHITVILIRNFHGNFERNSLFSTASDFFWALWLIMPLTIGCMAVAEERKLGVMEGQLCLPVSRRFQFAIKFIPTLIFGVLLGGVMPLLLEAVAAYFGAPNDYFKLDSHVGDEFSSGTFLLPGTTSFQISIVALSAGLALAGFFASTLAKNFLQALSIAIVIIVGCFLFNLFLTDGPFLLNGQFILWGMKLWREGLPLLIAILTAVIFFPWLAYRNFSYFVESARFWRRNMLGIVGALLFVFVSSAAIYNRIWEVFEPVEPTHGPAMFSSANPPILQSDFYGSVRVRLPDGRVWIDSLGESFLENQPNHWKELWWALVRPLPKSAGPQQFIDGSNWVSVTARHVDWWDDRGTTPSEAIHVTGYLDTVGVQSNGTLWISSKSAPEIWTGNKMMQFGNETNWQQVYRFHYNNFLLLKTDGTLWQWGTNRFTWSGWQTNWPSVRSSKLQQIGTNSDWQEIFSEWTGYGKKTNGSVWSVNDEGKAYATELARETNLDQIVSQTFFRIDDDRMAYVGKDGTLWICNRYWNASEMQWQGTGFLQVGTETNWVAVAPMADRMVALKLNGSLWQWNLPSLWQRNFPLKSTAEAAKIPPTRLSIHKDWIGLTDIWYGAVSLAADGSLWFWPDEEYYGGGLLKLPKQPKFLGNIFSSTR